MHLFERLGPPQSPTSWDRESDERLVPFDDAGLTPLMWGLVYAHIVFAFTAFAVVMVLGA